MHEFRRLFLFAAAALFVASCGGMVSDDELNKAEDALGRAPTLVTLNYDDTNADQELAREMMTRARMPGTFYVNSPRVGQPGRLTLAQLRGMQDEGHDIASHTLTHPHLTALSAADQKHEICDDRQNLLDWGFPASTIAWPFGQFDDSTVAIAKSCGFAGARGVGGVRGLTDCLGCSYAESRPPANPWAIREHTVYTHTTLAEMKFWVTEAETHGGGWVIILVHHVCDACDPYSTTRGQLQSLVDFLKAEQTRGALTVHSMRFVMGNGTGSSHPSSTAYSEQ